MMGNINAEQHNTLLLQMPTFISSISRILQTNDPISTNVCTRQVQTNTIIFITAMPGRKEEDEKTKIRRWNGIIDGSYVSVEDGSISSSMKCFFFVLHYFVRLSVADELT